MTLNQDGIKYPDNVVEISGGADNFNLRFQLAIDAKDEFITTSKQVQRSISNAR